MPPSSPTGRAAGPKPASTSGDSDVDNEEERPSFPVDGAPGCARGGVGAATRSIRDVEIAGRAEGQGRGFPTESVVPRTIIRYHVPMAFNVKDEEVTRLADELARRLHLSSRIDAIRHALRAQIEITQARTGDRAEELLSVLRTEVWPLVGDRSPISKEEREQALGYDAETGV